jgi:cobalt/nickel transport system permease protein
LLLLTVVRLAQLPALRIFQLSLFSVPFVGFFALILYFSGDAPRAWAVLAKSYLSAFSVLVITASTPLARLVAAGHYFRMPELLLQVTQLIYRYFFVVNRQAHGMQTAFRSRAGRPGMRALRASSGMVAVLFGRSYNKAAMVHQAMLGRCFTGEFPAPSFSGLRLSDFMVLAGSFLFAWGLHLI